MLCGGLISLVLCGGLFSLDRDGSAAAATQSPQRTLISLGLSLTVWQKRKSLKQLADGMEKTLEIFNQIT